MNQVKEQKEKTLSEYIIRVDNNIFKFKEYYCNTKHIKQFIKEVLDLFYLDNDLSGREKYLYDIIKQKAGDDLI